MNEMLANMDEGRELSLADYEARISLYREQIGVGYIGIGRTLIEAKNRGIVPAGQWESWVVRVTGLEIRQAQRCMQAAREIRDGSALARLEMSKALMLLSSGLDESQQEALAAQAAADGTTVRALREEIAEVKRQREQDQADAAEAVKTLKRRIVDEAGANAEIRNQLKEIQRERDQIIAQMRESQTAWQEKLDQASSEAYKRGLGAGDENMLRRLRDMQANVKTLNSMLESEREKHRSEIEALRESLDDAKRVSRPDPSAVEAAVAEKDRELRSMQESLEELERELEHKARQLEEARKSQAAARMAANRGGITVGIPGSLDLAAAVRQFVGIAGVLPQMGQALAGMTHEEREAIRAHIDTVARWVEGARQALGVVAAEDATVR